MNKKTLLTIMGVLGIIFIVGGVTFAYITWRSSTSTAVTFTVTPQFSCGADGGGNITSNVLAPAHCTNSNYAIKQEITVTHETSVPMYMDLYLNINNLADELRNSSHFRYALTTSSTSCETGVEASGIIGENITDNKLYLLSGEEYTNSTPNTYYLYIWIDEDERDASVLNKSFNFSLGGSCTDEKQVTYYTVTFDTNGMYDVPSQQVKEGEMATEPVLHGSDVVCNREAWCLGSCELLGTSEILNEYNFNSPVTSDVTLVYYTFLCSSM